VIALPCDDRFKHLTLVIDGSPQIESFAIDADEWMMVVKQDDLSIDGYVGQRRHISALLNGLSLDDPTSARQALARIVGRVVVRPGNLSIGLDRSGLMFEGSPAGDQSSYELNVPFHTKRRGVEAKMIIGGNQKPQSLPDQNLIEAVTRSFEWWQLLTKDEGWSIEKLAKHASMDASNVTRFLPLAFLAPDR
jgi:site-specific DNA recombinase